MRDRFRLIRYVVLWLAGGALVAGLGLTLIGSDDPDVVRLPPVRQTALSTAAREARCELRDATRTDRLNPPVVGRAASVPAAPGIYGEPLDPEALVAALERGDIVYHYRPQLTAARVDQLEAVQQAVPDGTILAPNGTGMPYEVAATAWGQLLGCERFTDASIDAMRLFRGRFIGLGRAGR